jgi:4-amino-4-deoxy-L-arabinose transferase-like glycosyltransferase
LLTLNRAILGDSLFAIHILPAIAGSAALVFVCLIVRELGGKLFATALSAAAFLVPPFYLMMNSIFGYDGFDQLALIAFLYVLVRFIRTENPRLWIMLGLIGGIACMTKVTILYLAPGFLVAFLFSPVRKQLLTRWPWAGLGVFCHPVPVSDLNRSIPGRLSNTGSATNPSNCST